MLTILDRPADGAEISKASGVNRSSVSRRATREDWPYTEETARGGKRRLYALADLPVELQAAVLIHRKKTSPEAGLNTPVSPDQPKTPADQVSSPAGSGSRSVASFTYSPESLWSRFDRLPGKAKESAEMKLRAIDIAQRLIDDGITAREAWQSAADSVNKGRSTVQRWHSNLVKKGIRRSDWLAALAPRHVGRQKDAELTNEAWDCFRADYLRPERPGVAACLERLELIAAERGWQVPSRRTIDRRIAEIPLAQRVLLREGESALLALYPPMQRSVLDLHAGEWINGDGYQHNVFVKWPDGTIARPKTWFWQDVYSRRILSWRTDQTEHTDVIRQSVGDLIEKYGVPRHATIDNTRAAANKWMTGGFPHRYRFKVKEDDPDGLFKTLDIQPHWTSVIAGKGHGQAKPVERAFGVGGIGEVVDKHPALAGAHTGKDTTDKPANYGSKAIDLADFMEVLAQGIRLFNAREGRRTEVAAGRLSFDQAFAQSYQSAPIRKATAEQRRLWMLTAEARRVDRTGSITLDAGGATGLGRNRYSSDALGAYMGKKVVARFDPQQLYEAVHVYTLDNRYIGRADCVMTAGFGDTEAGRKFNRARTQWMKANKAAAKAERVMTVEEVGRLLPDQPEPDAVEAGVIRPMFGKAVGSDIEADGDEHDQMFSRAVRQLRVPDDS